MRQGWIAVAFVAACQVTAPEQRAGPASSSKPTVRPASGTLVDDPGGEGGQDERAEGELVDPEPRPSALLKKGAILDVMEGAEYTRAELAAMFEDGGAGEAVEFGARVFFVTYETQAPVGGGGASSGVIVLPVGSNTEPRPVLAWNHGTTGTADGCEPSAYDNAEEGFLAYAARGVAVVATDYQGLGTPGPHYYLVGEAEALSVWDGVRAAHALGSQQGVFLSGRVALMGHSQGGHATLFAQQYHLAYANEFDLFAVVALAPAPIWKAARGQAVTAETYFEFFATYLWAAQRYHGGVALSDVLQPAVAARFNGWAETKCMDEIFTALPDEPRDVFTPAFLRAQASGDLSAFPLWADYLDSDSPGNYQHPTPVLLVQGDADEIVPPPLTDYLHGQLCQHGVNAKLVTVPGDHNAAAAALEVYVPWLRARFAGTLAANGCESR